MISKTKDFRSLRNFGSLFFGGAWYNSQCHPLREHLLVCAALDLLGNAWYNTASSNPGSGGGNVAVQFRRDLVSSADSMVKPMPRQKKSPSPLINLSEKEIEQLREIDERLHRVAQERRASMPRPAVHAEQSFGSITFRYETVRCGKANCTRCPHGPYWYAYWKENGRTRSRYVGRVLPEKARQVHEEKQRAKLEKHTKPES